MKHIFIIVFLFLSIKSQSQEILGEYNNDKNPMAQLVINKDSTFSYYDWLNGSCYLQINKSGFWTMSNDTLILISNGECSNCLEFAFKNYTDTTKIFLSFDQEIKEKFPDLKISFDLELGKQYDIDNENNLIHDLLLKDELISPFTISFRSKNFNSDIDLDFEFKLNNAKTNDERTIHDNLISIKLKPDYEKNLVQKQEIFAKYLITQSGELKLCDSINSLAVLEMKKKDNKIIPPPAPSKGG